VLLVLGFACTQPTVIPPIPDPTPPSLVSSLPVHMATGVSINADLVLNFSEAMNSSISVVSTPSLAFGAPEWEANMTRVRFNPPDFTAGVNYSVQIIGKNTSSVDLPITIISFTINNVVPVGSHPRILLGNLAEKTRLQNLLGSNSANATRFKSLVDRAVAGENIYGYEGWWSALLGQLTANPAYCTDAINRGEQWLSSEAALTIAGGRASVAGDSYLEVGEVVGGLMLTYDYCFSQLSTPQQNNWRAYAKQAVWNVWHPSQANWGAPNNAWKGTVFAWSGWSINDPINNYYYSFLQATMFLALATQGEDPETTPYLEFVRTTKIQNELVPMFQAQVQGGGSREGTEYGTAMKNLFRLYYFWQVSTGERIADLTSHAFDSMAYWLHAITPTKDWIAPIGDHARDSSAGFFDYHREMLLALTALYRNTPLAARVEAELPSMTTRVGDTDFVTGRIRYSFNYIWDFLYEGTSTTAALNLNTAYRATGTGHIFARSNWNGNATWFGFLSGAYTQSHAHRDGLSFLVFKNNWLVHDLNRVSASGIEQDLNMHATLQLENVQPSEGTDSSAELTALTDTPDYLYIKANSGTLYTNNAVKIERQVLWFKPNTLIIYDQAELIGSSSSTRTRFYLPLPSAPVISGSTATLAGQFKLFSLNGITPTLEPYQTSSRLVLSNNKIGQHELLNVIGLDQSVSSATGSANSATINLSDGRILTMQFANNMAMARVTLKAANQSLIFDQTLDATIQNLPLTK
jgi:hypothetical protein